MDEMDPLLNLLNQRPRKDWAWDFEPDAEGESAGNAVALCNAALLTYSAQPDVRRYLAQWKFEEPPVLRGSTTQGLVARRYRDRGLSRHRTDQCRRLAFRRELPSTPTAI